VDNEATGSEATVGGGNGNIASGDGATIPGGWGNAATGNYSFAAGYRAKAEHSGSFVWADNTKADFTSTADAQFLIRAGGGVGIGTNAPDTQLHIVGNDSGTNTTPGGHVALIEDLNNDADNQVLAIRTGYTGDPSDNNHFITFFNGNDTVVGAIEGDSAGGVTYKSGGADFAEYMPQLNPDEEIEPADIVGLVEGAVTKQTVEADRVLVVSSQPILVGNVPAQNAEVDAHYRRIALIGQVPVRVRGDVEAGDYIIPSGHEDGIGIAVAPEDITMTQISKIVGQALERHGGDGVFQVKTLVGLPQKQILETLLVHRDEQFQEQGERLESLEARLAVLEAEVDGDSAQNESGFSPPALALLGGVMMVGIIVWRREEALFSKQTAAPR
jgi:hypothetical protein